VDPLPTDRAGNISNLSGIRLTTVSLEVKDRVIAQIRIMG